MSLLAPDKLTVSVPEPHRAVIVGGTRVPPYCGDRDVTDDEKRPLGIYAEHHSSGPSGCLDSPIGAP